MADTTDSISSNKQWPFATPIPQRFSSNYKRYKQLGGQVDVADDSLAYTGGGPLTDVERLMAFNLFFDQIVKEQIPGDFLELGVYKGDTAALLARQASRLGRKLWLLDTFQGFDDRDFRGFDAGRRSGAFSDTTLESVRQRIGADRAEFIQGYFPETSGKLSPDGQYCLVHIDTDLYAPILSALEYFYPRMVPGGYLVIHDYTSLGWAGADRAVDDFFSDKPECVIAMPDSAGSAVVRRQRSGGDQSNWILNRQTILPGEWHVSSNGKLTYLLTDGWASAEDWGVWGVGKRHQLCLTRHALHGDSFILECDVHAYIPPEDKNREFDIIVDGELRAVWHFGHDSNRSINSIEIKSAPAKRHVVEFSPHAVVVPSLVDEKTTESRPLGLAIHRIRILN